MGSKLILGNGSNSTPEDPTPLRLPPLRKFAISRWAKSNGGHDVVETVIVTGHAIEPVGQASIAIVVFSQVGDQVIQHFARIFNDWRDLEELEADSAQIH